MVDEQHLMSFLCHPRKLNRTFPKVAWKDRSVERGVKVLVLRVSTEKELSSKAFVFKVSSYTRVESRILLLQSCCMVDHIKIDSSFS